MTPSFLVLSGLLGLVIVELLSLSLLLFTAAAPLIRGYSSTVSSFTVAGTVPPDEPVVGSELFVTSTIVYVFACYLVRFILGLRC